MKPILYTIIAIVAICLIAFWFEVYLMGNYYQHAGLSVNILLGLAPILIIFLSYKLITYINKN